MGSVVTVYQKTGSSNKCIILRVYIHKPYASFWNAVFRTFIMVLALGCIVDICLHGKHLSQSTNLRGSHFVNCLPPLSFQYLSGKASVSILFLRLSWFYFLSAVSLCSALCFAVVCSSFSLSLSLSLSARLPEPHAHCIAMFFFANRHPRVPSDRSLTEFTSVRPRRTSWMATIQCRHGLKKRWCAVQPA